MAETAAHMVDHVFPDVPVRQFVLSVPKRLRPYLHHRPKTATAVLHILLRALQATLREACPTTEGAPPLCPKPDPAGRSALHLSALELLDRLAIGVFSAFCTLRQGASNPT